MKTVIISKNIVNIEETVNSFKNLTKDEQVKKWLDTKLKKHLLKTSSIQEFKNPEIYSYKEWVVWEIL